MEPKAIRIPMMAMTIRSSIRVKPRFFIIIPRKRRKLIRYLVQHSGYVRLRYLSQICFPGLQRDNKFSRRKHNHIRYWYYWLKRDHRARYSYKGCQLGSAGRVPKQVSRWWGKSDCRCSRGVKLVEYYLNQFYASNHERVRGHRQGWGEPRLP